MIPCWHDVLRKGADVLSPAGSLHIVDFEDQAELPRAFKALLEAWLARFRVPAHFSEATRSLRNSPTAVIR